MANNNNSQREAPTTSSTNYVDRNYPLNVQSLAREMTPHSNPDYGSNYEEDVI